MKRLLVVSSALVAHAISPWPLESQVEISKAAAAAVPLAGESGLRRADYLNTIKGVVEYFLPFQNVSGQIIDQYRHQETQYATPCFAFAAATLAANGQDPTGKLAAAAALALDAAIQELATHTCADGHCNFFTKPVMFAFSLLKASQPAARVAQWEAGLQLLNPSVDYINLGMNWGFVATVGDFFRTQAGYGNATWWQGELDLQLSDGNPTLYTANGLYQDHSGMDNLNPLPYDTFPTSGYATVLVNAPAALGYTSYTGKYLDLLDNITTRAVWSHALMQSPWGEIPTGGRSSQHEWNEAVSTLAYEIFANKYKAAGDMASACILQRAARLSHASLRSWLNPTGEWQIVKNHFNASLRWGYEEYSYQSQYNLLPASMLAAAYYYADPQDSIPECTGFADIGGYVFQLPEHQVIIAAAGGTYVEIETGSDPHYDSTGMHRVHINNCGTTPAASCTKVYPLLTPTAGPPQENGGIAIGAWWRLQGDSPSVVRSLANQTFQDVTTAILSTGVGNGPTGVAFSVEYVLLGQGALVTENYNITGAGVQMVTSVTFPGVLALVAKAKAAGKPIAASVVQAAMEAGAPARPEDAPAMTAFGLQMPVFQFDGQTNSTVAVDSTGNTVTISAPGHDGSVLYKVNAPAPGHSYTWSYNPAQQTVTRNGLMTVAAVSTTFTTSSPSIGLTISAQ